MDVEESRKALMNALAFQLETHGSPEFEAVVREVVAMHRKKGADYGTQDDFFANVSASAQWGVSPWIGAMMRANDKIVRLQSAAKGSTLQNEGIEDSLLDIATYAIIAVCLFRRENNPEHLQLFPNESFFNEALFEERPINQ